MQFYNTRTKVLIIISTLIQVMIAYHKLIVSGNPTPGTLFRTFDRQEGLFGPRQKNCYKSCLLHPNHLKLGTTYLWTSPKTLPVVTWSKWWRQHSFWRLNHSTTNFLSYFQIFPLPKQYSQGKTVLLSSIQQQRLLGCFWPFSYFYKIS